MPRDDELEQRHDHDRAAEILDRPEHHEPPAHKEPSPNDTPDESGQPQPDAR